jgi:hypothetical protein
VRGTKDDPPLGKHSELQTGLADLRQIIQSLGAHETHVNELVQITQQAAITCDASAEGVGGVWLGTHFCDYIGLIN